jgi:hypothetical protein
MHACGVEEWLVDGFQTTLKKTLFVTFKFKMLLGKLQGAIRV